MIVSQCIKCSLCFGRTYIVNGDGNVDSNTMIIGEAPGYSEDKKGIPFIGKSGKLLTKELEAIGLTRKSNYYITNVIKCRPPANRPPLAEEIQACATHLKEEVLTVKPKVILALGGTVIKTCFGKELSVKSVRGKVYNTKQGAIICTYHPSAILRDDSGERLPLFRQDLKLFLNYILANINPYANL